MNHAAVDLSEPIQATRLVSLLSDPAFERIFIEGLREARKAACELVKNNGSVSSAVTAQQELFATEALLAAHESGRTNIEKTISLIRFISTALDHEKNGKVPPIKSSRRGLLTHFQQMGRNVVDESIVSRAINAFQTAIEGTAVEKIYPVERPDIKFTRRNTVLSMGSSAITGGLLCAVPTTAYRLATGSPFMTFDLLKNYPRASHIVSSTSSFAFGAIEGAFISYIKTVKFDHRVDERQMSSDLKQILSATYDYCASVAARATQEHVR